MAITIAGSGIVSANIADGTIVDADMGGMAASKLTGALAAISLGTVAPATPVANTLYADSIVKRWCNHTDATTVNNDVGISSITNGSTGQYTFTFATAMSTNYSCTAGVKGTQTSVVSTIATTSQLLFVRNSSFALAAGSLNMNIAGND